MGKFLAPHSPPSVAVSLGATTPVGPGAGARIWSTTTGCELVWDGAAWVVPSEGVQRVVLGTDRSSTVVTAADVTGLSFSVLAGVQYYFEFWVIFQTSATTTGIQLSVDGPASPTLLAYSVDIPTSATARVLGNRRAYNVLTVGTAVDAINVNLLAKIGGVITPSAAGTLIVRFASEIAATTATVKAGSFGMLRALSNSGNTFSNPPLVIAQNAATSYTLVLGDANTEEEFTSGSAVTVTVPPESSVNFPVGTIIMLTQGGAGQITVAPGAGVTINSRTTLKTAGQWSTVALKKRGSNEWTLTGDVAAI